MLAFVKIITASLLLFCSFAAASVTFAAISEGYNIIYIRTDDLTRVLDYKEELESVFDMEVKKKLKIVGRRGEYALIFDSSLSSRKVAKTLIKRAELLDEAGFDEPYAIQERKFDPLFNVSYGIGPNLSPLKEKFQVLYTKLGEEVKRDLFILSNRLILAIMCLFIAFAEMRPRRSKLPNNTPNSLEQKKLPPLSPEKIIIP